MIFYFLTTHGQENPDAITSMTHLASINVSGGKASSSAGSVTYSIGVVLYSDIQSSNTSVLAGIQQPEEVENLNSPKSNLAKVFAYPNPMTNFIIIDIPNFEIGPAYYQFFDLTGSLLKEGLIENTTTKVSMDELSSGTYILGINVLNTFNQTLKIVKP